jgi:hypothetical protein
MLFWGLGVMVFAWAQAQSAIKPNSPFVLRSPEWMTCDVAVGVELSLATGPALGRAAPGQSQLHCFLAQPEATSYPAFNALMYSLDALFPVLQIGQREYWRPDTNKPWGSFAMAYFYFQAMVGWALSLLAIAGFSGLVRSR